MESAAERKQRLKALKEAALLAETPDADGPGPAAAPAAPPAAGTKASDAPREKPVLKFRNYVVKDQKISHEQIAPAHPPQFEAPVVDSKPEDADEEELLASVAPKKANWDLKRDIEPKLAKLERRTQRALLQMLQEEERAAFDAEGGVQD